MTSILRVLLRHRPQGEHGLHAGDPDGCRRWLEEDDPRDLLRPAPVEMLQCFPVSSRVNSVRNDAPDLIAPAR